MGDILKQRSGRIKMSDKHNLEWNKIFAAALVAGIIAMLCGFVSHTIFHKEPLEKTAIDIDTTAVASAAGGADAAPAGPEPILAMLGTADAKKGEALGKACLACHSFGNGEPNKIGPNLYGIVNNHAAHKGDFAYSEAIKGLAAKNETWTYAKLNAFIFKPQAYAPGTKMTFPGLKKAQDRADVIAYLRTLSDSPAALPSADEIKAEAPAPAENKDIKDAAKTAADDKDKVKTVGKDAPNTDEAQASDKQKSLAVEKVAPTQNAAQNDQSKGQAETTGAAANPALKPQIGQ